MIEIDQVIISGQLDLEGNRLLIVPTGWGPNEIHRVNGRNF